MYVHLFVKSTRQPPILKTILKDAKFSENKPETKCGGKQKERMFTLFSFIYFRIN